MRKLGGNLFDTFVILIIKLFIPEKNNYLMTTVHECLDKALEWNHFTCLSSASAWIHLENTGR